MRREHTCTRDVCVPKCLDTSLGVGGGVVNFALTAVGSLLEVAWPYQQCSVVAHRLHLNRDVRIHACGPPLEPPLHRNRILSHLRKDALYGAYQRAGWLGGRISGGALFQRF